MTKELVMTCRRFSPAEAKQMGFVNRVVPLAKLQSEAEELARELIAKPSVPVAITKEHVNAVTRAMGAGFTSFGDGDALLGASIEKESREAALAYRQRTFGKKT
jgi:enoyl-CoA hydratase/carnithine racemase